MANDKETTVQELKDLIAAFTRERDWEKHHTPKNLAISIAIEAAELMEHFQWDELKKENREEVENELADILTYIFEFANTYNIDVTTAYKRKLAKSAKKYPVELFNSEKNRDEDYFRIKKEYRSKKR